MQSVLIVSDSHGLTNELDEIKQRHHVTHKIHCGDSELEETVPILSGFTTVKGNCDWGGNFPEEEVIKIGDLRFYVTHGHLFGVKQGLLTLQYRAQELGADIVCYGHTHIAYAKMFQEQLFINPGSIRSPLQFRTPSYTIVTWSDSKEITVDFYDLSGQIISTFPYEKSFLIK